MQLGEPQVESRVESENTVVGDGVLRLEALEI